MKTTKCCWNKWVVILCMAVPILVYFILSLLPSFMTFFYSFTDIRRTSREWSFVGLENYLDMFYYRNPRDTWAAVGRSLIFAFTVTGVQNIFALLLAVLFNSKLLRGRTLYRLLVFLPYVLGTTVSCYIWVLMMNLDGPVMTLLGNLGIQSALLGSAKHAFICVMFIQIWMSTGYAMVLDLAGLQGIPTELYEAASIDGSGAVKSFFNITVPLLWPTLSINILLSIIGSLGSVQSILLTTGGDKRTETLAMRIYSTAFSIGSSSVSSENPTQGYAAAQSMVQFVIVLFFALITNFITKRREKKYET